MNNTTFEAVREDILDTVAKIKAGTMDANTGLAVAANYKVFNDNVFAQVAQRKLALVVGHRVKDITVKPLPHTKTRPTATPPRASARRNPVRT